MRRAIAEAVVGDDVFGDDPTVQELERRVAALAGKEAALYVPSGTMGNQLAVHVADRGPATRCCSRPSRTSSSTSRAASRPTPAASRTRCAATRGVHRARRGRARALRDASDDHVARVALLCLENTHNRAGGAIVPLERAARARRRRRARAASRVHLDGARLWNASVATGIPIARLGGAASTP